MECDCCRNFINANQTWNGCSTGCTAVVCKKCYDSYTRKNHRTGCMFCNPMQKSQRVIKLADIEVSPCIQTWIRRSIVPPDSPIERDLSIQSEPNDREREIEISHNIRLSLFKSFTYVTLCLTMSTVVFKTLKSLYCFIENVQCTGGWKNGVSYTWNWIPGLFTLVCVVNCIEAMSVCVNSVKKCVANIFRANAEEASQN